MKISVGLANLSASMHKHNSYEIIFYRRAEGELCLEDGNIAISSGKFIIVPPNTAHASKYTGDAETFYIKGDYNHIFSFFEPVTVLDNSERDGEFLVRLIYENRFSNSEYLSSLSNALAHFLLQNIQTEKRIRVVLRDIVTKISDSFYDSNINVGELFKKSGYAEDYIRAQFKIYTGKTPVEFLTEMRINHACYLIDVYKDTLTLSEIAEKCGYTDYMYFSRRFKTIMGMSPKKYMSV